jgi:hypothetical protein
MFHNYVLPASLPENRLQAGKDTRPGLFLSVKSNNQPSWLTWVRRNLKPDTLKCQIKQSTKKTTIMAHGAF